MDEQTAKLLNICQAVTADLVPDIKRRHMEAKHTITVKQDGVEKTITTGQYVTGQTSDLLHIEYTENGFKLVGWKYSGTYEEGRKPGKMPPSDGLIEWAKAKGLTFKTDAQARSWAFCVARKIAREGTNRYKDAQDGHPTDIFQTPINDTLERLKKMYVFFLQTEMKRTLLRADLDK